MSVDKYRTVNLGIYLDQWIEKSAIYIDNEICVENGKLGVHFDDPIILAKLDEYDITLD